MTLSIRLKDELKEALRRGDRTRAGVFRMLLSELHARRIEKRGELSEEDELKVLMAEAKKRREAHEAYVKGGRDDLAENEERELRIIEEYLPEKLSPEKLREVVERTISELDARGPSDLGRVMGKVMAKVRGQVDGAEVRAVVEACLKDV